MGDIFFPHIGFSISSLNRVAVTLFGIDIYWYGILISIGSLLGILLCLKEAKRTGQSQELYTDFAFIVLIFGIIGARLYYIIFSDTSFSEFFKFREGGLGIYGGIITGLICAIIYTKVHKVQFLKFGDTIIMSLLVGQILGRWGNFFNREAFGKYTNGFFAMAVKADTVSGLAVINDKALYLGKAEYPITVYNNVNYIQVHPTFLYESIWNLFVLSILFSLRKNKKFEGQLSALYFMLYGLGRFFIESLRTDQLKLFGLPISMLLSALLVIMATIIYLYLRKNK